MNKVPFWEVLKAIIVFGIGLAVAISSAIFVREFTNTVCVTETK